MFLMIGSYSLFSQKPRTDEEVAAQINRYATISSAMWMTVVGTLGILFLPLIVSGLIDDLAFTKQQAGYVAAAEMAGVAILSGSGVFWVRRFDWVDAAVMATLLFVAANVFSALSDSFAGMFTFRFLVGASSGALLAIGLACQSDSKNADRIFGYWVACQMTVSSIGYLSLPLVRSSWGTSGMFVALALIGVTAIISIYFLPRRGVMRMSLTAAPALLNANNILALVGALLFFTAQGGIWAFVERLGIASRLSTTEISFALAVSSYCGIVGGLARNWIANFIGSAGPFYFVVAGEILMLLVFGLEHGQFLYALAVCMLQFFWAMGMASLLAGLNIIDDSGRLILLMMATAKVGYSLGPALMGWLIFDDDYTFMLATSGACVVIGMVICVVLVNQKSSTPAVASSAD
jgi:predicted MFS family arabinose efflux permease